MMIEEMQEKIMQRIADVGGHATFVELGKLLFPDENGTHCVSIAERPNTILWSDMSEQLASAFQGLLEDKKITYTPTPPLTYMIDGGMLKMPIARARRNYKELHWLPVVLNRTDGVGLRERRFK